MGPRVIPVNYTVQAGDILFRTNPGSLLGTYAAGNQLAFEIDRIDEQAQQGWSVVALGEAELVEDMDEITGIWMRGDPEPWADGSRNAYLRLRVRDVSGRRLGGDVPAQSGPTSSRLVSTYLG
jgi:nitroimidazol reductase NimA-like FMN-containing flavoprotein (pyridoxamine 5'-phosphate oxidase superfamily)